MQLVCTTVTSVLLILDAVPEAYVTAQSRQLPRRMHSGQRGSFANIIVALGGEPLKTTRHYNTAPKED